MRRLPAAREPNPILSATETRSGRIGGQIQLLQGIELDNHRSEGLEHPGYVAIFQLPAACLRNPHRLVSHLILKSAEKKKFEKPL